MSLAERLYRLAWSRMLRPQRWIATGHALCQVPPQHRDHFDGSERSVAGGR
jgi:hypothetical protein